MIMTYLYSIFKIRSLQSALTNEQSNTKEPKPIKGANKPSAEFTQM